jgi:hypothetical protein
VNGRRFLPFALPIVLPLAACGCGIPVQVTPAPADAPAEVVALSGASVMIGVGDIAKCGTQGDELTAMLVDSVLRADSAASVENVVFTLGDNAYPNGDARDFALCFGASWGDSTKGIMTKIRPAPGNHEHRTDGAAPYYQYFGDRAGAPTKGYYSYDIGAWHALVLNSEIVVNSGFTEAERQAQEDWLRQELQGAQRLCTIAYWHNPRFSSGWHGSDVSLQSLWQILYDGGVDLVLNGHDHNYERFHPQTPSGMADSVKGITQYVVGTGGGTLRGFRDQLVANSAMSVQGHFGVLKLTLGKEEYRSAFLDVSGRVWDAAGGKCH